MNLFGALMDILTVVSRVLIEVIVTTVVAIGLLGCFVYTLLGKKDLGTTNYPPMGTGLMDGDIAFRQHNGGHTDAPNWPVFLEFAARYFEPVSTPPAG